MKLALAIMFRDEAPLLRLHLPVWLRAPFDGFIALDGGSTDDSAALCQSYGAVVYPQQTTFPPSAWENELVEYVEQAGYSHIFRLDADELVHPESVAEVRETLANSADAVWLPRYNFMGDRLHYADAPPFYPDFQMKAWKLGCGVRYQKDIDSVPDVTAHGLRAVLLGSHHLYHYSFVKPMAEYLRKRVPLEMRVRGETVNGYAPPPDAPYPAVPVPFVGMQPLDPETIGSRAPYE